jgi:hypothetical protein
MIISHPGGTSTGLVVKTNNSIGIHYIGVNTVISSTDLSVGSMLIKNLTVAR